VRRPKLFPAARAMQEPPRAPSREDDTTSPDWNGDRLYLQGGTSAPSQHGGSAAWVLKSPPRAVLTCSCGSMPHVPGSMRSHMMLCRVSNMAPAPHQSVPLSCGLVRDTRTPDVAPMSYPNRRPPS
jgi:hypothetical protein